MIKSAILPIAHGYSALFFSWVCTVRARAAYLFAIYAAVAYQSSHTWALRIGPPMQGGVI